MEVVILPDEEAIAEAVATIVVRCVETTPEPAIGLATGSSPLPTYRKHDRLVVALGVTVHPAAV